jgi:hypothetical protein
MSLCGLVGPAGDAHGASAAFVAVVAGRLPSALVFASSALGDRLATPGQRLACGSEGGAQRESSCGSEQSGHDAAGDIGHGEEGGPALQQP